MTTEPGAHPDPSVTNPSPADRPPVACLCGSMRFEDEMRRAAVYLSLAGVIVLLPLVNMKQPNPLWADETEAEEIKAGLDALHRAKIRPADEVVIVCPGGYIGESTRAEIAYAEELGKPITFQRFGAVA
jgi:hypothetical protein